MNETINVRISKEVLLDMLLDRCDAWGTTKENKDLFEKMYESYLDSRCFDGAEFNPLIIVDNDAVNYCTVISAGDEDFTELKALYKENGTGDISCETFKSENRYSYIEAVSDEEDRILVRY